MFFRYLVFLNLLFCLKGYCQVPPSYSITTLTKESTGYYFLSPNKPSTSVTHSASFNIILDKNGELVYFKKFIDDFKASDFKLQPNGQVSYFSNNRFYFMDQSFIVVDSLSCLNGIITDHHDMQVLPNGHFLVLGHEHITADLSEHKIFRPGKLAGSSAATMSCGVIQELDKNKQLVFEWNSRDHFKFEEIDTFYTDNPKEVDWTHFNALELDQDGNILLSVRNFSEISKISRKDGSIIWRLGGTKNQFRFINDPGFRSQHDIRRLSDGHVTLFDNGRAFNPFQPAVAKEYELDEKAFTITLVWKFMNDSTIHSGAGQGNVQRLPNGNTLVNYGRTNKSKTMFSVVTPQGNKCFEIEFKDVSRTYRAFNYPELPFTLKRPVIKTSKKNGQLYLDAGKGYEGYLWSNGAITRTIPLSGSGKFYVGVKTKDGGYLVSAPYIADPGKK